MASLLNADDLARLAKIVREETGNEVHEKNHSMLESRLRSHIGKLGISAMSDYWQHFGKNESEERAALQSLMTTHYTFFFREYAHFEALEVWIEDNSEMLKQRWAQGRSPVKIWSAAASRGQEAYSLAMFLELKLFKKHGVPFEVLGTDIDPESIAYATNGVYPLDEVNTIPRSFLDGNWKRGTGSIREFGAVHANLKSRARFEVLNLLELAKFRSTEKFDVIFCRNVFIYFSPENIKTIALGLAKRLRDEGLFVSGMSEPLRFEGWNFQSVGPSCYRRTLNAATSKTKASLEKKGIAPDLAAAPPFTALSGKTPDAATAVAAPTAMLTARPYRVLCVDDSVTIQTLMRKIFSTDPLCEKVDVAGNGREAKEALAKAHYDLITLDIHMPEVGGIEFLERFYRRDVDAPVLMISSVNRTDIELATRSITLGAFDYVEKPALNALQRSTEEILMKAKMAMRTRAQAPTSSGAHASSRSSGVAVPRGADGSFDASLGQKIVLADPSQCLRIVFAASTHLKQLEQIVRAQSSEERSPPMILILRDGSAAPLEGRLKEWSNRTVTQVRDERHPDLRVNQIHLVGPAQAARVFAALKVKASSMQIIDRPSEAMRACQKLLPLQILVDESLSASVSEIERLSERRVNDVSPATSFASLSLEYFANRRKAA